MKTKVRWHVVADYDDADPMDYVWTVSMDPKREGWRTDGGHCGYGLTRADAEELASAANYVAGLKPSEAT